MNRIVWYLNSFFLFVSLIGGPVTAAAAPLTPVKAEPVGIGGGGGMFSPAISPFDPKLIFLSCDMSGFYRTDNGGRSWTMEDGHMIQGSPSTHVIFHPGDINTVYQWGPGAGGNTLRISHDRGVTWQPIPGEAPWGGAEVIDLLPSSAPTRTIADLEIVVTVNGVYTHRAGDPWTAAKGLRGAPLGEFLPTAGPRFVATAQGVFRSEDDGRTWTEADAGLPWHDIRQFTGASGPAGLALYVTIPGRNVNGKYDGGVYRSGDGGRRWTSAMGAGINVKLGRQDEYGIDEIPQYFDIATSNGHLDTVYVVTRGTGYWPPYHFTVFKTTDGGQHWHYTFNGDPRFKDLNVDPGWIPYDLNWGFGGPPTGFTVSRGNPDVALYANGGAYLTTNGGQYWSQVYTARAPGQGKEGPGQRWTSIGMEVTTNWNYVISPKDPQVQAICYTDIGFARSVDGGHTWQWSATGSPWQNTFFQLAIDPDVPGRVWAAASNQHDIPHWTQQQGPDHRAHLGGVVVSHDGMKTWAAAGTGLPDAPCVSVIVDPRSPAARRRLWASFWGSGVYRSDDGGATWVNKSQGLGYPGNLNSYRLQLGADGTLYDEVALRRQNGNQYPVPGGLWRSADGGDTWQCVTTSLKPFAPMDYALDPRHPQTIYLCQSTTPGGETGGVYKTTDGGETWTKLPLKVHPAGSENAPYVHAFAPVVHPLDSNILFVTTEGEGIWISRDAGQTWSEFRAIPFLTAHRLTFTSDPHVVYITTFGGGVWRVTLQ